MGEKNVVKLEDVCEFFRGLTYSKKNETTFSDKIVLRASNIDLDTSTLVLHDLKYLKENFVIPDDKKLQKDCIFICMSSGSKSHLGKVAYIARDYDYAFGGFMGLIKPKTNILPRYLFYLLQTPEYKELIKKLSNGININNIKFSDLKEFQFELPSLEEQEKILNILDKADEIRTKKKQANEKLDEFLKSTFVNMFGDPVKNEKHYKQIALAEIGKFKNGINFNSDDNGYTIKCIGVGDFKNNIMLNCVNNIKNVELNQQPSEEYFLRKNDIIFVRSNGSKELVGRTLLINTDLSESVVYSGFCIRLRVGRENINNMFLLELLNTKPIKENMKNDGHGCNIKSLNQSILGNIPVILPPIEEQNKFAQIVEKVEEQKQRNEKVIEQMDNLFNSLSQQAFKGEL